eukprot:1629589-Pleurochrysis_carterae.AAC.1
MPDRSPPCPCPISTRAPAPRHPCHRRRATASAQTSSIACTASALGCIGGIAGLSTQARESHSERDPPPLGERPPAPQCAPFDRREAGRHLVAESSAEWQEVDGTGLFAIGSCGLAAAADTWGYK